MKIHTTDRQWEKFGQIDPYYGVVSHEKYRGRQLETSVSEAFSRSGEVHIDEVVRTIQTHFATPARWRRAMDFGCGVGRLALPLAHHCDEVVGVDVSPSMLKIAEEDRNRLGLGNVKFVLGDDQLSRCDGDFDLIHSYIVFQHIHPSRGMAIFRQMLQRLRPGGIGVCHFTYDRHRSVRKLSQYAKASIPFANAAINLVRGRRLDAPHMQMHRYDLGRLHRLIQTSATDQVFSHFTDHGGELGVVFYFRRSTPAVSDIASEASDKIPA